MGFSGINLGGIPQLFQGKKAEVPKAEKVNAGLGEDRVTLSSGSATPVAAGTPTAAASSGAAPATVAGPGDVLPGAAKPTDHTQELTAALLSSSESEDIAVMTELLAKLDSRELSEREFLQAVNTQREHNGDKEIRFHTFTMVFGTQGRAGEAFDKEHMVKGLKNAEGLAAAYFNQAAMAGYITDPEPLEGMTTEAQYRPYQKQQQDMQAINYVLTSNQFRFEVADEETMQRLGGDIYKAASQNPAAANLLCNAYHDAFADEPGIVGETDEEKLAGITARVAEMDDAQRARYYQTLGYQLASKHITKESIEDGMGQNDVDANEGIKLYRAMKTGGRDTQVSMRFAQALVDAEVKGEVIDTRVVRRELTTDTAVRRLGRELAKNPGLVSGMSEGEAKTRLAQVDQYLESDTAKADALQARFDSGELSYSEFRDQTLAAIQLDPQDVEALIAGLIAADEKPHALDDVVAQQ